MASQPHIEALSSKQSRLWRRASLLQLGLSSLILTLLQHEPMATKLDITILAAAIEGFEAQKLRIDIQIAELRQLMTGATAEPAALPQPGAKRRKVSAAGRKRMAEAQQKRWAVLKQQDATPK